MQIDPRLKRSGVTVMGFSDNLKALWNDTLQQPARRDNIVGNFKLKIIIHE